MRLEIYRTLARAASQAELDEIAERLSDRFGAPPDPLVTLLALVRLRLWCRESGIDAVHAGPKGIAITLRDGERIAKAVSTDAPRSRPREVLNIVRSLRG